MLIQDTFGDTMPYFASVAAMFNARVLLLVLPIAFVTDASSRSRYSDRMVRPRARLMRAKDCDFGICEDAPHYPEDRVRDLVDQHGAFHSFLTGKVIRPIEGVSVGRRNNVGIKTFCQTTNVVAAPKLMLDIDRVRRHIVNLKNYSQILEYQTCDLQNGEECFKETILDVKTKCMQRFSNIKLVTVDVKGGILEYRTFRIPSTCVCTYIRDFK